MSLKSAVKRLQSEYARDIGCGYTRGELDAAIRAFVANDPDRQAPGGSSGCVTVGTRTTTWANIIKHDLEEGRIPELNGLRKWPDYLKTLDLTPRKNGGKRKEIDWNLEKITDAINAHHSKTGFWPRSGSGSFEYDGRMVNWVSLDRALRRGNVPGAETFKGLTALVQHIAHQHATAPQKPKYVTKGKYPAAKIETLCKEFLAAGRDPEDLQNRSTVIDPETGWTVGVLTAAFHADKVTGLDRNNSYSNLWSFLKDRRIVNVPEEPETPELAVPAHA